MLSNTHQNRTFDIARCKAKVIDGTNLANCLAPGQAHLCDHSLTFGEGFFCKHPRRKEIIEAMEKLRNELNPLSDTSQSANQE